MYAVGIHLGSLTTQAVYMDVRGDCIRLTDLEDACSYPIPSWVALDASEPLIGHTALRWRYSESPPPLIRFAREALLVDRAVLAASAGPPCTADTIGLALLNKVLCDVPTQRREDLWVALTVPDGISALRRQRMKEVWRAAGLHNLAFLEDSLAALYQARASARCQGQTILLLVFDEDALKITLLRCQSADFVVAASTVVDGVSLLSIRNALAAAIARDAQRLIGGNDGQGALEPAEMEDHWYHYGDAFISHCADAPQTPFNRELILRYRSRYLTLLFTPAALDSNLNAQRRLLENSLLAFAQCHADAAIDQAFCIGKLGRLLQAPDLLQTIPGLRPQAITVQPDTALAHGAAMYAAQQGCRACA